MTDLLAVASDLSLRAYGVWTESEYTYGVAEQGPVAVKRFEWRQTVRAVHGGGLDLPLHYFADAIVDSRRMNELTYVAAQQKAALIILESMVRQALAGVAYLGMPDPIAAVTVQMVALARGWIDAQGPPPSWEQEIADRVRQVMTQLTQLRLRAEALQARVDPERPTWGLAIAIVPPEPRAC
jgi:hypothetical protein